MFVAQLLLRVSVVCQTFIITLTFLSVFLSVWSQGVGRRYAHVVLRKADIDLNKRAGELTDEEVRRARCLQTNGYRMVSEGNVVSLQEVLDCVNR